MVLYGIVDEEILAALRYLPEYPTCSKAMCWYGIQCAMNFAWPAAGLSFLVIESGDLREFTLLVRMKGLARAGGSQNFVWVF